MPEVSADPWAPGVAMGQQMRSQDAVTNIGKVSMQGRAGQSCFPLVVLLGMFPAYEAQCLNFLD